MFNGKCHGKSIIYKVTSCCCGYKYVGVTQQIFKDQMKGHFSILDKYLKKKKDSSSLTKHLAWPDHWPDLPQGEIPTPHQIQEKL